MEFSKNSFVSPDEIMADVALFAGDSDFRMVSQGWYISQIQQALQELAFDTFFDKQSLSFEMPENLRHEMPEGMFNLTEMYLFNGDVCNIQNAQNVWFKRRYFTGGNGYVARDTNNNNNDPFYKNRTGRGDRLRSDGYRQNGGRSETINNLYYYNIDNGYIMFSSSCLKFEKVFIQYSGMGCNIGDQPIIPTYLREAVKTFTLEEALKVRIAESKGDDLRKWQMLFNTNNNKMNKPYLGTWEIAKKRVKHMDNKSRNDLKEYLKRFNY